MIPSPEERKGGGEHEGNGICQRIGTYAVTRMQF